LVKDKIIPPKPKSVRHHSKHYICHLGREEKLQWRLVTTQLNLIE